MNLAPQQARIAALVAQGLDNSQVAIQLGLSTSTVKAHLQVVYRKLGLPKSAGSPRVQLAAMISTTAALRQFSESEMKNKLPLRQGDVLLLPVDQLPAGCIEVPANPAGHVVLAFGEQTGHFHRVEGVTQAAPKVRMWSAGAERFLQVLTRCELIHQEHSAVVIEPGAYQLPSQFEHTEEHTLRQVAD